MPPAIIGAAIALGASAAAAAGIITATTALVIGIAATAAGSLLTKTPSFDFNAYKGQQERKQVLRAAAAPRTVVYGTTVASGTMIFAEEEPGKQVDGEWLHMALALAAHPLHGTGQMWLGDDAVETFGNNVTYEVHNNRQTADPFMLQNCPSWKEDMIGKGISWLRISFKFDAEKFPSGLPNVRILKQGREVYDPRNGQMVFTDNAALVILDYLRTYLKRTDDRIDWESFKSAANICDEMVYNADGTQERRYRINGEFDIDEASSKILDGMLEACGGEMTYIGGKHGVLVGAYYGPAQMVLDESCLSGDIKIVPETSYKERTNTITGTYIDPEQNYAEADFPAVAIDEWVEKDGGPITQDQKYRFVTSAYQAQRLATLVLRRKRIGRSIEAPLNMRGYKFRPGMYVKVRIAALGMNDVEMRVTKWSFDPKGGINVTLRQDFADMWDDAIGKPVDRPDLVDLPTGGAAQPQNLTYTVQEISDVVQGVLSWTNSGNIAYNRVVVRQAGKTVWTAQVPGDMVRVAGLLRGAYTAHVVAVAYSGAASTEAYLEFNIQAPAAPSTVEIQNGYYSQTLIPKLADMSNVSTQFDFWYNGTTKLPSIDPAVVEAQATRKGIGTSWTQEDLTNNRDYYWYIRTINAFGSSAFIEVKAHFELAPGNAIDLIEGAIKDTDTYKELDSGIKNVDQKVDAVKTEIDQDLVGINQSIADNAKKLAQEVLDRTAADKTNADKLAQESKDRLAGDAATAQQAAEDLLRETGKLSTSITQTQKQIEDVNTNLSNQISLISAGVQEQFDFEQIWRFDESNEGWTEDDGGNTPMEVTPDGWLKANNSTSSCRSPNGLTIDASAYRSVKLRIKKVGNVAWRGRLYWVGAAEQGWSDARGTSIPEPAFDENGLSTVGFNDINWNASGTVRRFRLDLATGQDANNYFLIDWIAVGRPSPGASTAALQREEEARVQGDQAEARSRELLAAQVRGNYDGTDPNQLKSGLLFNERQIAINREQVIARDVTALETAFDQNKTQVQQSLNTLTDKQTSQGNIISGINADLATTSRVPNNLITNASFERDKEGWTGWNNLTTVVTLIAPHGGTKGMRVAAAGNAGPGQNINFVKDRIYEVGVWVKQDEGTTDNGDGNNKIRIGSSSGAPILEIPYGNNKVTKDWKLFSREWRATETGQLPVTLSNYLTAGTRYFDDFYIIDITDAKRIDNNASAIQTLDARVTTAEGAIQSQASAVTQLESRVDTLTGLGTNLVANFDFADGLNGWGYRTGTTVWKADAGDGKAGIIMTGNGKEPYPGVFANNDQFLPSLGGRRYRFAIRGKRLSGTGDAIARVYYMNDKGQGVYHQRNWQFTEAFQTFVLDFPEVPSYVTQVKFQLFQYSSASSNAIDSFAAYDATDTLAAAANASAIQGLETRVTKHDKDIEAQSTATTQLRNDLNATNREVATKASAEAVNQLSNRVTATEEKVTSQGKQIVTLNNSLVSGNLIVNGDMTEDLTMWEASGTGSSFSYVEAENALMSGNGSIRVANSTKIPVEPGMTIKVSLDMRRTADMTSASQDSIGLIADWVMSSDWLTRVEGWARNLTTSYATYTFEFTIPNDFQGSTVWLRIAAGYLNPTATARVYVRNVQVYGSTGVAKKANSDTVQALTSTVEEQGRRLTAQNDSITNLNSTLNSVRYQVSNPWFDGSLESYADGQVIGNNERAVVTTSTYFNGTRALKIFRSPNESGNSDKNIGPWGAVRESAKYRFEFWAMRQEGATAPEGWHTLIGLQQRNAANANSWESAVRIDETNLPADGRWRRFTGICNLRGGEKTRGVVWMSMRGLTGAGTPGYEMFLDDVVIVDVTDAREAMTTAEAAASATQLLTTRVESTEQGITSLSQSVTNLSNSIDATNKEVAKKASQQAVDTLAGRVTETEKGLSAANSKTTALEASIKAAVAAGDNLIPNPTFDPAYNQMNIPVVDSTVDKDVPAGAPFRYVARLEYRDHHVAINNIPAIAGRRFRITAMVAVKAGGTATFNMYAGTANTPTGGIGSPLGSGGSVTAQKGATWTKSVWEFTVPQTWADRGYWRPFLQISQSGPDFGTVWYATDWQVRDITEAYEASEAAKANAKAIDGLNTQVTQAGKDIEALAGRTTKLETGLDTANKEIAKKATSEALNQLSTKVSEVDGKVSTQGQSITQLENNLSSLDVGGANLIPDSLELTSYGKVVAEKYGNNAVIGYTLPANTNYVDLLSTALVGPFDQEEYVLSFMAKGGVNGQRLDCYFYSPNTTISAVNSQGGKSGATDGQTVFTLTTEWKRYWVKWKQTPTTGNKRVIVGRIQKDASKSQSAWISAPKLEVGNIPTAWSEAPIDNASAKAVSALDTRVTKTEQGLTTQSSATTALENKLVDYKNDLDVSAASPANMLANASFERDFDSWQGAASFITIIKAVNPRSGAKIAVFATGTGALAQTVNVVKDRTYRMGVYARCNAAATLGDASNNKLRIGNASGGLLRDYLFKPSDLSTGSTWKELKFEWKATLTGAVSVSVNSSLSDGNQYFDDMYFMDITDTINAEAAASAVSQLDTRVTKTEEGITAVSKRVDQLSSSVNDAQANIDAMNETVTSNGLAMATGFQQMRAQVGDVQSAITSTNKVVAELDKTTAEKIDTVTSSVGNVSSSVQQVSQTVADLNGKLNAQWGIKVQTDNNGVKTVAGIQLGIDATGESAFLIDANTFGVYNSSKSGARDLVFAIKNGQTYLREGFIENGTITNAKIANAAIDSAKIASHIQSDNYVDGSQGWAINKNGAAQFNNVTVRGHIEARSGSFKGTLEAQNFIGDIAVAKRYDNLNFRRNNTVQRNGWYQNRGYGMTVVLSCTLIYNVTGGNERSNGYTVEITFNIGGQQALRRFYVDGSLSSGTYAMEFRFAADLAADHNNVSFFVKAKGSDARWDYECAIENITATAFRTNSNSFS